MQGLRVPLTLVTIFCFSAPQVKSILGSRVQDVDSIIDAVPDLMNPQQLTQSLSNLVAWFPNHDPFELLQQNPQILENPNVEADPTYGEYPLAGFGGRPAGFRGPSAGC
jgi:hypothetical protein